MNGETHLYIHSVHGVGGVTSWAFQAISLMPETWKPHVVAVTSVHSNQDLNVLFPHEPLNLCMDIYEEEPALDLDSKLFNERHREFQRPTTKLSKPAKPTKPPKPPKESKVAKRKKPLKESKTDPNSVKHWHQLHATAKNVATRAGVYIPNYIEFGYRLSAIAATKGLDPRCIGFCHADVDRYYDLMVHYEGIIQSFVAVSTRCRDVLVELLPQRASDIHLIPCGVRIPPGRVHKSSDGPLRILYAGRLVKRQKRIMDFIDLATTLETLGVEFTLDFFGEGQDEEQLRQAFSSYPHVKVRTAVPHTQMASVYPNYDVFVLTSQFEGTSVAMLEAMAHKLVPVVTRVSGADDLIQHGFNGFLFNPGDTPHAAQLIATLATNPSLRHQLARAARKSVSTDYDVERQCKKLSDCLSEAVLHPPISRDKAEVVLNTPGLSRLAWSTKVK